jgi:EAL domain-containing protein (putative c-di-GMP-specific phosphodiesterase class I)
MRPDEFIRVAEETGLINPLTTWVLNDALRQRHMWRATGLDIGIAINLSPLTLQDRELVKIIRGLLRGWSAEPESLAVEITETALVDDFSGAMETLTELRSLGVCVSIDDFGAGYSSLSHLIRFPVDQIKIDKSFVRDMVRNDDSARIVRSVIDLGHSFSLEVVAEGVEDQETWDLLAFMGCDVAQGFHLSRPLPAAEIQTWLTSLTLPLGSMSEAR